MATSFLPTVFFKKASDIRFGLTGEIGEGRVEVVDPRIQGSIQHLIGLLFVDEARPGGKAHHAETQGGEPAVVAGHGSVLHGGMIAQTTFVCRPAGAGSYSMES
jgi:hypothetical protein